MVTDQQVDHYRTFGFVVLPAYLEPHETATLTSELDHALRDGFGAHYHQRPSRGGIEGHYLPMMNRQRTRPAWAWSRTPVSSARPGGCWTARCCRPTPRASCCSARPASTTTTAPAPPG